MLLLQVEQLAKQLPDGEKELLHWIIYILITILIIVVTYFVKRDNRKDRVMLELTKDSITHIGKTNEVISVLTGVVKENTQAGAGVKSVISELHTELKTHNDYLRPFLQAVQRKEI